MRVKLCARCPYTPRDLALHYDPEAALYACAKCDNEQDLCVIRWRSKCATEIETSSATVPSVAPFARESLASSAITARGPRSAQRNASNNSRNGATTTQDGSGALARPDEIGGGAAAPICQPLASVERGTAC
jgi:hypothetical protein